MTSRPVPPGLLVVDVSSHQPRIDWGAVARAGVVGAYVRVAEGVTPDTRREEHMQGAIDAGLLVGAYQYCRARHDGGELADAFLGFVSDGLALPHVLDVEEADGQSNDALRACVARWLDVMDHAGQSTMIYTGAPFWDAHASMRGAAAPGEDRKLWLAAYVAEPPRLPRAWKSWALWQFTDAFEYAPGSPRVDCSVFRGNLEELAALAIDPNAEARDVNP